MNNDLISRKALLSNLNELFMAALRKEGVSVESVYELDHLAMLVKEAPAVTATPQWISVEDELPEDDIDVLVYGIGRGNSTETVIAMTSYTHNMYAYGIEGWRSPWEYFHRNYNITHWMLLPEPPHVYSEVNIDERKS